MNLEEYKKLYGHYPSPELMAAWESGPQAVPRFKDKPVREAIYGLLTDTGLTTEGRRNLTYEDAQSRVPDFRSPAGVAPWTDPRMLVSGIGDVVSKSADPEDSPSKWDWGMGLLDIAGLGGPKMLKMGVDNLRNYVKGFYGSGGNQPAAMAVNVARAPLDVAKQVVSPAAAARGSQGLSSATHDVLRGNLKTYDDLAKEWKTASKERRDAIARERRDMARQMAGQLNQNVIHNQMRGTPNKALQEWYQTHFKNVTSFERPNASQIFDDVDAGLIFDMSQAAWMGSGKKTKALKSGPGSVAYAEKVGTKGAGNSHRDIFASREYNTLRRLSKFYEDAGKALRTRDDYISALNDWDPNWQQMTGLREKNIVDGTNGVLFQFSPTNKSDYLLGGFNAIMKFGDDGTAKFFGTDKQDIFGRSIPGASDAVVGIGSSSRKIGWKTKRGKISESTGKPARYKQPPKTGSTKGDAVLNGKRKVRVSRGSGAIKDKAIPSYLSKKERELINSLLALDSSVSPSFLASRGTAGAGTASLLGMDYYE